MCSFGPYSSRTTHIIFWYSYAAYNCIMRWCCNEFIISTSRSTFRLSSRFGMGTNLAASCIPLVFSLHLYTVPNLPLRIGYHMISISCNCLGQRGRFQETFGSKLLLCVLTVPPHRARRTIYGRPHCGLWSHRALEKRAPELWKSNAREKSECWA